MAVGSHIPMESVGKLESERKGGKDKRMSLLEEVLNEANIERAIKAVMANKGAPGVDGMKIEQLPELFATHGNEIREAIRNRTYEPTPVRRREIPKPSGGVRKLGIPTARDRVIQQAIAQAMSPQGRHFLLGILVWVQAKPQCPNGNCEMS